MKKKKSKFRIAGDGQYPGNFFGIFALYLFKRRKKQLKIINKTRERRLRVPPFSTMDIIFTQYYDDVNMSETSKVR